VHHFLAERADNDLNPGPLYRFHSLEYNRDVVEEVARERFAQTEEGPIF